MFYVKLYVHSLVNKLKVLYIFFHRFIDKTDIYNTHFHCA